MNLIASKEELLYIWNRYAYGLGPFIVCGLIVSRTIQVFSRVSGTERPIWTYGTIMGIGAETGYCWFYAKAHGNSDLIPFEALLTVQILLLAIGLAFRAVLTWRGGNLAYFPSTGKHVHFEDWNNETAAQIAADSSTAAVMIVIFHMTGSPLLAGWFQLALCWLLACHAFGIAQSRDRGRQSRFRFDSHN